MLLITNAIMPDQLGGLQRYVRELGEALVLTGACVHVLTKGSNTKAVVSEITNEGLRIHRFAVPTRDNPLYAGLYPLSAARAATRVLQTLGHRVIPHVHYPLPGFVPALLGRPYVHTFHAPVYQELLVERQDRYALPSIAQRPMVAAVRGVERLVARRAERTVVLSEFMRRELGKISKQAADRAEIVAGGLDTVHFSPGPGLDDSRAGAGRPVLFTARRLVPRTGVQELVRAMPAVLAALPDAVLVIAGTGPLEGAINAEIVELGLTARVRLIGRVSDQDLVSWYRTADVFVMPTQELEGFGLSTVEALACGTPVVGTPAGATPEILNPVDPRLVAAGTKPDQIAAGIVAIASSPDLLRDLSQRARSRIEAEMSWPVIAERHLEIYERIVR